MDHRGEDCVPTIVSSLRRSSVSWNGRLYTVAAVDRAALGMVVGGILWVVHGVFEMIAPFGVASVYDGTLGYDLITDRALYLLYGIPGAVALILSSFGLITLARGRSERFVGLGRVLAFATLGAGVLSGLGLAIGSPPMSIAPIGFGTPVLGAAACFVATGARSAERGPLLVVGALGLFALPLRPLVYALQVIPLTVGAAIIGLFGLGWVALGWRAMREDRPAS